MLYVRLYGINCANDIYFNCLFYYDYLLYFIPVFYQLTFVLDIRILIDTKKHINSFSTKENLINITIDMVYQRNNSDS